MKPIYQNGEIIDYSDEEEFVNSLNNKIDLYYKLKKLPPRIKQIAELILAGYTYKEIADKMSLTETNIQTIVWRYKLKV